MVDVHSAGKRLQVEEISNLIIGGQTGADTIQFYFKDTLNGVDLSDPAFNWFIQFKNKNGQGTPVPLISAHEDGYIKLAWTPDSLATQVAGRMQIQVFATIVEGEGEAAVTRKKWVSEDAVIYVQENLNPDPIVEVDPPIFDYYLTMYTSFKEAAEASAAAALASEQAAGTSEDNAALSAAAALASEQAAGVSEDNATLSAAAALASEQAAGTSEDNAALSAADALASEQSAGTSEYNAALSAAAALASEQAAGTSEDNSALSAAAALASEQAAGTSEDNAALSAAAALASEQAAGASEDNAALSAAAALASEQAAGTSEDNAALSAAAALASEQAAEDSAAIALASKNAAEAAAASVLVTSYYGLRRRSDGVYSRTGAAVGMTPARSNGTYNPTVSDFRKVRPWADIRLCLTDRTNKVVAVQGDDNFLTMANAKNEDGSHVWNFGSLFYPFYQKIWTGVDENSFAFKEWDVSAVKLPGYNMHPAFVREDGTIRPYIVLFSYKTGEDVDGKVCSKPGVVPLTVTSTLSFDTKYTQLDPASAWLGNHFTTNDAWKILVCIEWGTMDIQNAVGQGISSSMPYSTSATYQLTQATDNGNAVTVASSGQPFYAGMDVQIGSSYSNSSYAKNRKVLSVDTTTVPGSMIITVDGAPFSAPVGAWIVTWGQSDTVDNLLQIGTGCGWISQWGSESRSHVYIYGLVDPYANVFEFERGKMRKSKKFYINFNALTSAGITDPESAGYTDCGEFSTGAADYGWISDFKIVTLGDRQTQLVSAVGGSSIGDVIYYANDARTGIYVCSRGGNWDDGSRNGPFYGSWGDRPSGEYISGGDRGIILEPALQAA